MSRPSGDKDAGPRPIHDALAEAFIREGVATCFALLGDGNMHWAGELARRGCRMIYVRHEHCAVAAAMAHARKTGGVGVATVTCGPGVTQTMTALPAAVRARIPLIVFAGEAPIKSGWYNQGIAQAPLVTATGAAYHALHHPDRMAVQIRDAFLQARREERPVVVGVPLDLQQLDWPGGALPTPSDALLPRPRPMPPHPDEVAEAAARIRDARRIVVMAGLGAMRSGAAEACRALAERCDGLLATTLPARGLFIDDPFCLGVAGGFSSDTARACFAEADLVVAVGTSLAHHNADGGKLFPGAHVLQVDIDPVAMSQGRVAAQSHLRADARLGVEALIAGLPRRAASWRTGALAARIRECPPTAPPSRRSRGFTIPAPSSRRSKPPCPGTGRWSIPQGTVPILPPTCRPGLPTGS